MAKFFILSIFVLLSCNQIPNNAEKNNIMKEKNNKDSATVILQQLNDISEKYYNKTTCDFDSTGEVQAYLKNLLLKLDKMKIKYKFDNGRYLLLNK